MALLSRASQKGSQSSPGTPLPTLGLGKLRQGKLGEAQAPLRGCFVVPLGSLSPQIFPGSVHSSSDPDKHSLSSQSHSTKLAKENLIFPFFSPPVSFIYSINL